MSYVQPRPRAALGDLTCWGIDLGKWRQSHQVPVFNNQYNVWYVQLAGESFSTLQAEDVALRLVRDKWFGPQFSGELGVVDAITSKVVDRPDAADGNPLKTITTDASSVTWVSGPKVLVRVQFAYRGSRASVPWPVYSGDMFGPYCPKNVRAAVAYAMPSVKTQAAPPQDPCSVPGAWGRDPKCIPNPADALKRLPDWMKPPWWVWATVAGAGVIMIAPYVWPVVAPIARSWTKQTGKVLASEGTRRLKQKNKP